MVKRTHETFIKIAPYVVTITLFALTTLVGANIFFLREKNNQLETIRVDVGDIKTDIAVMQTTVVDVKEIRKELSSVQTVVASTCIRDVTANSKKISLIADTVTRIEAKL